MTEILILIAAFFLDLAVGDPRGLPHPVRIIGKGINVMENVIRRSGKTKKLLKAGGVYPGVFNRHCRLPFDLRDQ